MSHPLMFTEDDPLLARVRTIAFFTQRVFCYFGGSQRIAVEWIAHDAAIMVRPDPGDDPALRQDSRFWVPAYLGPAGWLGIDLNESTDWQEVAELIDSSYRVTAPKRLVRKLDPPSA